MKKNSRRQRRKREKFRKFLESTQEKSIRTCRVCGCTDYDCSQCIEKIGEACHWVEDDLCSACAGSPGQTAVRPAPGEKTLMKLIS